MIVKDFFGQCLLEEVEPGRIPVTVQVGIKVGAGPEPFLLLIPKPGSLCVAIRGMKPAMVHMVEPSIFGIVKYPKPLGLFPPTCFQLNCRAKNFGQGAWLSFCESFFIGKDKHCEIN